MNFSYTFYSYDGIQERILNIGDRGHTVLFIPALFVESNRLRALTVAIMRNLAQSGIRCLLPDLPGTLESKAALENQSMESWDASLAETIGGHDVHIAAIRGGCLLGSKIEALSRWHFAPLTGEKMMRELFRARQASLKEQGESLSLQAIEADSSAGVIELAGEHLGPALSNPLKSAQPFTTTKTRTIRLQSDPAMADQHIDGPALWRRSEPVNDPALAHILADDIKAWIES